MDLRLSLIHILLAELGKLFADRGINIISLVTNETKNLGNKEITLTVDLSQAGMDTVSYTHLDVYKRQATMLVAGLVSGCGGGEKKAEQGGQEIVVGVNVEQTGNVANYGKSMLAGFELAVEEANKAGGIDGKTIRVVVADNKSEPSESGNAATKIVTKDKVIAVVGPATSGCVAVSYTHLYYALLIEKNKVMNLTALTEPEDVVLKHFVDSLYAYKADPVSYTHLSRNCRR